MQKIGISKLNFKFISFLFQQKVFISSKNYYEGSLNQQFIKSQKHPEWYLTLYGNEKPLAKYRKKDSVNFVFLEGPSGTAKGSILERLKRMGYQTFAIDFIPFCLEECKTSNLTPQNKNLFSMKWMNSFIQNLEKKLIEIENKNVFYQKTMLFL